MPSPKSRLSRGEKALFIISVLFLLITTAGYFGWRYLLNNLETDPVVSIPTPVVVANNAFDDYVKAGGLANVDVLYNFVREYRMGAKILPSPTPAITTVHIGPCQSGAIYYEKELDSSLKMNSKAMVALRRGFGKRISQYSTVSLFTNDYSPIRKIRLLTHMLIESGMIYEYRGRYDEAIRFYTDTMRLGVDIPNGAGIFGQMQGLSIEGSGQLEAWECIDKLSASEARSAALRVEEIDRKRLPLADSLHQEKWLMQASLMQEFRKSSWRDQVLGFRRNDAEYPGLKSVNIGEAARRRLKFTSKRSLMDDYTRSIDALIATGKQPYPVAKSARIQPSEIVVVCLLGVSSKVIVERYTSVETQNHLLAISLALHAYRLEYGVYPASLKDLIKGKYLTAIPSDPFAIASPLRYKRIGARYLLYSIGPDSKDDGGMASADGQTGPDSIINTSSTGDIVAGVNVRLWTRRDSCR